MSRQAELALRQQEVQSRTFTRWVNLHLADRQLKISDIKTELSSGVNLAHLLEIISNKTIPKWNKNPKLSIHRVENLNKCIEFILGEGLTLVNIGATDIETGNLKIILGLIWTLILRYQINKGKGSAGDGAKNELMKWVNSQIEKYGLITTNFSTSYQDPKTLCALLKSLQEAGGQEGKGMDLDKIHSAKAVSHIDDAMSQAEAQFQIPRVVDAQDMAENPDELSTMTYISYYRDAYMSRMKNMQVDPDKSYAKGPGLKGTGAQPDAPPSAPPLFFDVFSVDAHGKPSTGAVECTCALTNKDTGANVPISVRNTGNGTFHCEYGRALPLGEYQLNIALNGKPIHGYPSTFTVKSMANPDKSYAKGPGLEDGVESGDPREFLVFAMGDGGKLVKGAPVEVIVKGPKGEPIPATILPVLAGPGSDSVSYVPSAGPGKYHIEVKIDGRPISNMPVLVTLQPGARGKNVGKCKFKFTCMARGEEGERMTDGGDNFEVFVEEQGSGRKINVNTEDHGDGSYSASYELVGGKLYTVRCLINHQDTAESPFVHDLRGREAAA